MNDESRFPPVVDALIQRVDDEAGTPTRADAEASWSLVAARIEGLVPGPSRQEIHRAPAVRGDGTRSRILHLGKRTLSTRMRWVVAGFVMAAGFGIAGSAGVFSSSREPDFGRLGSRVHRTAAGERSTIVLGAGTSVMLAPNTSVTINSHAIVVRGEAYFAVTPHRARPFVVYTRNAMVRVLGTRFDVRQYDTETEAQVAVVAGKVSVHTHQTPVTLAAGMLYRTGDSGAVMTDPASVGSAVAWTTDALAFRDVPVSTVLRSVSQWWGYQFRLDDPTLATQHVTTVLAVDTRANTLKLLQDLLDVTMTVDDSVVTIHTRRARRPSGSTDRGARSQLSIQMEKGR
jgi:ferric-dicitrate binding protein FerR (iron transport regulator)